jgi:hypothetical protein
MLGRRALIALPSGSIYWTYWRRSVAFFKAARATVNPVTDLAPASRNAFVHESGVTPEVITSSTSKTRKLSTWLPGRVAKTPRTASHLSS